MYKLINIHVFSPAILACKLAKESALNIIYLLLLLEDVWLSITEDVWLSITEDVWLSITEDV